MNTSVRPDEGSSIKQENPLDSASGAADLNGSGTTNPAGNGDQGVTFDEDEIPVPNGIEEVDEDKLEETGESLDLDMDKAKNQVWLVKLTPKLAEIWKKDKFLDGQELGQIKIQRGTSPPKILLDLNDKIAEHRGISQEYQLRLTKQVVDNEYIFSEAEFDQFKRGKMMYNTEVVDMPDQPRMESMDDEDQNRAATWTRSINGGKFQLAENENRYGRYRRNYQNQTNADGTPKKFVPYAKTIPKKTDFVGKVVHECQIIPTKLPKNDKSKLLEQKRKLSKMVRRHHINYLKDANAGILQGRAGPNIHTGATITLNRDLAAKKEAARSEGRAARMDKDAMMKLLFDLFNQYDYWTLKGLRKKTSQPEAYLKECLESIAVMERKGPYALKYRLKEEYRRSRDVERRARQGVDDEGTAAADDDDDDDDDDVEDIEMEDVAEL